MYKILITTWSVDGGASGSIHTQVVDFDYVVDAENAIHRVKDYSLFGSGSFYRDAIPLYPKQAAE